MSVWVCVSVWLKHSLFMSGGDGEEGRGACVSVVEGVVSMDEC